MRKICILLGFLFLITPIHGQKLHLFGGDNQDEYLGCINSDSYESDSIWNEYGDYGSPYSSTSIWNEYGNYGGEYSSDSPFNEYASNPPVIVDAKGNFYGYLTINKYRQQRASFTLVNIIYRFWKVIPDDVSGWYDEIFN